MLWSILWSFVQVCSLNIEYQVFQYVPSINISEHLTTNFWHFSHGFHFFFFEMMLINAMFCVFPANLMSSTYTDENNPFSRCTKKHSQWETFSQPYFNRNFSNCLSHNIPAKGWPYRFRSGETTGSSMLDHDFGHLCRGRRIQMSGHSDLGIFKILEYLQFLLGISGYRIRCLSCAPRQSGYDIHDSCCCHLWCWWSLFCEFCMRSRIIFHNIASEYNSTFVFSGALPPIRHSLNDRCPSVKQNELLRPSSLHHRSPLIYFWLSSGSTPEFSPVFPTPCPKLPWPREFSSLEA